MCALALGMKFTAYTKDQSVKELNTRIEVLEKEIEAKAAQQMLLTMTPLIKRVKDISSTLGV